MRTRPLQLLENEVLSDGAHPLLCRMRLLSEGANVFFAFTKSEVWLKGFGIW